MRLLIIGGTRFLGRFLVESALAAGHEVTLFHRGKTNPGLFPQVDEILGDRNEDLVVLRERRWEAAIDTCGFTSRQVRAAGEILESAVEHYTFISSLSVYAGFTRAGQDETAPLEKLPEGTGEDAADMETYGARKALCEQALEETLPGRVFSVRAGMIVGPYDYTDRFPYWVRRSAQGGEVLAPGRPDRLVQLIDARDLADWILRMVEARRTGAYNATSPQQALTMQGMLEACREAGESDAAFTWVSDRFLLDQAVVPWSELPFWLPEEEYPYFFSVSVEKALQAGLKFRPVVETARDTLTWDRSRGEVDEAGRPGLAPEREAELLRAWRRASRQSGV